METPEILNVDETPVEQTADEFTKVCLELGMGESRHKVMGRLLSVYLDGLKASFSSWYIEKKIDVLLELRLLPTTLKNLNWRELMARKDAEFLTLESGPVFKKSEKAGVRISLVSISGKEMLDVRQVYRTDVEEEWLPTPKGFTLPLGKSAKVLKKFAKFAEEIEANADQDA